MASADLGDALLARLNEIFREDPAIDEIGLLFGTEAEDLTVENAFMAAEHKLGVAFSAGPVVFRAARTRFHVLNALLQKNVLDDATRDELLACTRAVVLISADFYTAWNTRKEYVRRGWLDALDEVTFTNLVFSLHPKSIDTWAYRRWLATLLCEEMKEKDAELDRFFLAQVELCGVLAERHARNYHAWSFRHWIVSHFKRTQLENELLAMDKWCETHLKDHSGWNHRQHTLRCLLRTFADGEEPIKAQELLVKEYEFLSKIVASYPQYEALWCHRRFVLQSLLVLTTPDSGQSEGITDAIEAAIGVVCSGDNAGDKGEDTEWLINQWGHVRQALERALQLSAVQDLTVAWGTGNRFARRYALWLLERLRSRNTTNVTLVKALDRLDQAMRAALVTQDALLDDLWRS